MGIEKPPRCELGGFSCVYLLSTFAVNSIAQVSDDMQVICSHRLRWRLFAFLRHPPQSPHPSSQDAADVRRVRRRGNAAGTLVNSSQYLPSVPYAPPSDRTRIPPSRCVRKECFSKNQDPMQGQDAAGVRMKALVLPPAGCYTSSKFPVSVRS